jgi:hypothetical protein
MIDNLHCISMFSVLEMLIIPQFLYLVNFLSWEEVLVLQ